MMKTVKIGQQFAWSAAAFGGARLAFAGAGISPTGGGGFTNPQGINGLTTPINRVGQVQSLMCSAINWLFWIIMVFAIIMFLIGAFRYLTSAGESEKTTKARKTLVYAAIAVVIAIIAGGVPNLIGSLFYQNVGQVCPTGILGILGSIF